MTPDVGFQWLDYLAVVVYLAVTAGIVYWSSRKQDDTEDFFLGGRSMPWFAVGLSIMATLLSTNTYLGAPGEMIKNGPAYVLGFMAYPLVAVVVLCVWIPFFMRLRLTSAYEYLERRFDYRARLLGNLLFLGLRLGWMSMVVYTASLAMTRMVPGQLETVGQWFGVPKIFPVIVTVGLVATIYGFFGGMRAVIWTDVLQAVMLFGGVLVIIGFVAWEHGTWAGTWWREIVAHSGRPADVKLATWDIAERSTVLWTTLSIFFWNTCTHCSDQVALQRYFTTSSLSAARRSFVVNIVSAATIGILLSVAGLALRYHYQINPESLIAVNLTPESGADEIMPHFYATALPAGFGGLILVSFLCDAMQTLVSGVNSISAIITTDVSERREGSDKDDMRLARWLTIGVGAVATLLAVLATFVALQSKLTIFDMLPKMFNLFLGPLSAMFMVGMLVPRARARTMLAAVTVALIFSFCWSWWPEIGRTLQWMGLESLGNRWLNVFGFDAKGMPRQPTVMLAVAAPCVVGFGVAWLLSWFESGGDHPGREYTWWNVTRRPPLSEPASQG